jgi:hypothetical protein
MAVRVRVDKRHRIKCIAGAGAGGGQLGNGGSSQQLSPTQVDGGAVYLKVETGGGQGCGINASSKLRCWGFNLTVK